MPARPHRLTLLDRGLQHVHRWVPRCSCGWKGVQRRRKVEAVDQHRSHMAGMAAIKRRVSTFGPRPLTPTADLPEALR